MEKKKKKKKINIKRVIIFLIIISFLCLSIYYLLNKKTKNIIITGNEYYTDEQIIETAKIENYPKYLLLSKQLLINRLKKLDLVEEVKISKNTDFILKINIKEKKILYLKRSTNEYILSDGKSLQLNNIDSYPVLINYVEEDIEKKFIEKFSEIDTNIIKQISEIEYNKTDFDNERFIFYMNDGNQIYINIPKLDVMNKYNSIVSKFNGKRGILNLDSGNYLEVKEK